MPKNRFPTFWIAYLAITLLTTPNQGSASESDTNMCGPECVYVAICALRPENSPESYSAFCKSIPKGNDDGYSMADLQEIASAWDSNVELLRLTPET